MRAFAALYAELDRSTSTLHKLAALQRYFQQATPADAAWAVYFLAGGKPRQTVPTRVLRSAAVRAAGIPDWLFEESYQAVGDLAETIARLLPDGTAPEPGTLEDWLTNRLLPLRGMEPAALEETLVALWAQLVADERFVMNKLITGGFRVGVSRQTVTRALSQAFGIDAKVLAQRMIGYTDARQSDAAQFLALVNPAPEAQASREQSGQPYPFFLAQSLQQAPDAVLGPCERWIVEWKWDGIRAQAVRRAGQVWLWSRGEELVTERFPELAAAITGLPDGTVIDGEILAWDLPADRPMPFAALQKRITRKSLTARILKDIPTIFLAYDLLEDAGTDSREQPLAQRRARLEQMIDVAAQERLRLSSAVLADSWDAYSQLRLGARALGVEGFMLKRVDAPYGIGRAKATREGEWWKWKIDPLSVDCVLIYAQRGHGRRASLYTDYTFAVWDKPASPGEQRTLVPFAKAYSGLTDAEIASVDAVIRRTTVEKFGPVRSVTPSLVFELGFEAIARSPRHKSGIAVRFPRMLRLRPDKTVEEADTLVTLEALLSASAVSVDSN